MSSNAAEAPLIDLIRQEVVDKKKERPSLLGLLVSRNARQLIVFYPRLMYRIRALLPLLMLATRVGTLGLHVSAAYLWEYLVFLAMPTSGSSSEEGKSLRRSVDDDLGPIESDLSAMIPLRKGRW